MECGDAYLGVVTIATAQQAQEVVMVNVKKGPPTCVWGHLRSSGCSGNVPHLDVGDGSLAVAVELYIHLSRHVLCTFLSIFYNIINSKKAGEYEVATESVNLKNMHNLLS